MPHHSVDSSIVAILAIRDRVLIAPFRGLEKSI